MSITTKYRGPEKLYFYQIINNIIKIGNLKNTSKIILDYGCGEQILSKILLNKKILNYDSDLSYSDYKTIDNLKFDIVIMNHVLMYLSNSQIIDIFNKIKSLNPNCEFIIGVGKQNLISKIAKTLALNFNAHKLTNTSHKQQIDIIYKYMNVLKIKKNIYFMTDIYLTTFI